MDRLAVSAGAQCNAIIEGFIKRRQIFYDVGHHKLDPMHPRAAPETKPLERIFRARRPRAFDDKTY